MIPGAGIWQQPITKLWPQSWIRKAGLEYWGRKGFIEFAEFVIPRGDPIQLHGDYSANIVKVLSWANDPAILQSNIVTVLMTEGLHDLNPLAVENPHSAKLKIPLPDEKQMGEYLQMLAASTLPDLASKSEVPMDVLARRLTGLSRVGARTVLGLALNNEKRITAAWLSPIPSIAPSRS